MKKYFFILSVLVFGAFALQAKLIVPTTGPYHNLALYANTSESDAGWGGGSSKTDLVDGLRTYEGQWARGLAFQTNVWKQVTINFGQITTFDRIIQWYHGGMYNNEAAAYRFQYWNGEEWIDFFETSDTHAFLKFPNTQINDGWWYSWSTPYENHFPAITTDKLRIWNFPLSGSHTWLYEVEVYNGFEISMLQQEVVQGTQIEVPVNSSLLSENDNVIAYQFLLNYDPSRLEFDHELLYGTIAENGTVVVNPVADGQLQISYMTTVPLAGSGPILKLVFNTIADGFAYMNISEFLYNTTSVSNIINAGTNILENIQPTAYISYSDDGYVKIGDNILITATFNEPMADSPVPQILLSGANWLDATNMTKVSETQYAYLHTVEYGHGVVNVTLATGTDKVGNVVYPYPGSGETFTIIRPGDVDDNSMIQAYDAALTLQHSVGLDPLPSLDPLPWEMWRMKTADVDKTGDVTANDASMILRHSAGLIDNFSMDAPSNIGAIETGDISISVVDNELHFRSTIDLYGLNISVQEGFEMLGQPVVLKKGMLSAFNISNTCYRVGLATPYSPEYDEVFMKIPLLKSGYEGLTFDLVVNTFQVTLRLDITTGDKIPDELSITCYPNPVTDFLHFKGVSNAAVVTISDITGKRLLVMQGVQKGIDVRALPTGVYHINVKEGDMYVNQKLIKQ